MPDQLECMLGRQLGGRRLDYAAHLLPARRDSGGVGNSSGVGRGGGVGHLGTCSSRAARLPAMGTVALRPYHLLMLLLPPLPLLLLLLCGSRPRMLQRPRCAPACLVPLLLRGRLLALRALQLLPLALPRLLLL